MTNNTTHITPEHIDAIDREIAKAHDNAINALNGRAEHNTPHPEQSTPEDTTANRINRLREIRRISRQLGYVLDLPQGYNNYDIDQAASELSTIIEVHNEGVGL